MANTVYTIFKTNLMNKAVSLVSDSFKIALFSALTITPSDTTYGSLTGATETSGTGYTTGGEALVGLSTTSISGVAVWVSTTNPSWTGATFSAAFAVIYDLSVSNDVVGVIDFGGTQTVSGGTFTISWATSPTAGSILTIS